eukprot:Polyplicarium_translucidae@DN4933_c0_g1_i1.p1
MRQEREESRLARAEGEHARKQRFESRERYRKEDEDDAERNAWRHIMAKKDKETRRLFASHDMTGASMDNELGEKERAQEQKARAHAAWREMQRTQDEKENILKYSSRARSRAEADQASMEDYASREMMRAHAEQESIMR